MRHVSFPNRRSPCRSRKPRLERSPHRLPSSRPAPRSPARRCSTCRCSDSVPLHLRARHRLTSARSAHPLRGRADQDLAHSRCHRHRPPTGAQQRRTGASRLPPATSPQPVAPGRCRGRRDPTTDGTATGAGHVPRRCRTRQRIGRERPPHGRSGIHVQAVRAARGRSMSADNQRLAGRRRRHKAAGGTRRGHGAQRGRRAGRHRCDRRAFAALGIDAPRATREPGLQPRCRFRTRSATTPTTIVWRVVHRVVVVTDPPVVAAARRVAGTAPWQPSYAVAVVRVGPRPSRPGAGSRCRARHAPPAPAPAPAPPTPACSGTKCP